jgi:hypothetical protein
MESNRIRLDIIMRAATAATATKNKERSMSMVRKIGKIIEYELWVELINEFQSK